MGGQGDELDHKYVCISPEEAEEGWNDIHDTSQHACMHSNCGALDCQARRHPPPPPPPPLPTPVPHPWPFTCCS